MRLIEPKLIEYSLGKSTQQTSHPGKKQRGRGGGVASLVAIIEVVGMPLPGGEGGLVRMSNENNCCCRGESCSIGELSRASAVHERARYREMKQKQRETLLLVSDSERHTNCPHSANLDGDLR